MVRPIAGLERILANEEDTPLSANVFIAPSWTDRKTTQLGQIATKLILSLTSYLQGTLTVDRKELSFSKLTNISYSEL